MTQSFVLTGTTSWPVPNGWSNTGAFVEGLGAGGKGSVKSSNTVVGGGGGGGEYRKANLSGLTTGNSITVAVGDGTSATPANTTFNATTLVAKPGGQGSTTTAGAGGTGGTGAAANANGGAGAKLASTTGSGGGGAGGPSGAGTTATTQAGGAANGGTVAGGTAGNPGNTSTTFDSTHGCGSGGSGGPASNTAGFAGGNYGGGSGSNGAATGTSPAVAKGGDGLLCITYTANLQTITSSTTPTKTLTTAKTTAQAVSKTTTPTKTLTTATIFGGTITASTTPTKSLSMQTGKIIAAFAQHDSIALGTTNSGSLTAALGTVTKVGVAGDIMITAFATRSNTIAITGFAAITPEITVGSAKYRVFYRVIQAGDGATFAWTTAGSAIAVWVSRSYSGQNATPVDAVGAAAAGTTGGGGASGSAPAITVTTDALGFVVLATDLSSGLPAATGYTPDIDRGTSQDSIALLHKQYQGSQNTGSVAWTWTTTDPITNTSAIQFSIAADNAITSATLSEVFSHPGSTTNQSIDATTSPLASLVRQTGKIITATTSPVVSLARSIATSISAATSAIASLATQFTAAVVAGTTPKFEGFRRNLGKLMR